MKKALLIIALLGNGYEKRGLRPLFYCDLI